MKEGGRERDERGRRKKASRYGEKPFFFQKTITNYHNRDSFFH